jgi:hypothetical protein
MQDGSGGGSQIGDGTPPTHDEVLQAMKILFGANDPLVYAFEIRGGKIQVFDFWNFQSATTGFHELGDEYAPVVQLDDDSFANVFEFAIAAHTVLKNHEHKDFGKYVPDSDIVAQAIRRTGLARAEAGYKAEVLQQIVLTYASVLDVVDIALTMEDLANTNLTWREKALVAVIAAVPFINARGVRAAHFVDNSGNLIKSKVDEALQAIENAPKGGLNRLFGHNEYIVTDAAKLAQTKSGLMDYFLKHGSGQIEYVDDLAGAVIDTRNGVIQISKAIRDKYPHLLDGYLMEELQHFHQLHSRGWLGHTLTQAEHDILEHEVIRRLLKSGLEIFDPR